MNKSKIADLTLLLVAFIWGTTFVLVQNAVALLEPFTFNGIRFLVGALFLLSWLILFAKKQLKMLSTKFLLSGVLLGIVLFAAYALQTFGLLYTTSSKAGFITGLSVVLVPIFSLFLLKQKPTIFATIGVIIATAGLYLLSMADPSTLNLGDLLVFFCAIGFALHIILTGKYTSQFPSLLLTVIQISTVAILSLSSALLFEDWKQITNPVVIGDAKVWGALLVTSLFATAFAFLAQTNFQKFTTPTRVALIFAMEPVFAAITAYIWAHERLGEKGLIGCVLIFVGMILAELPTKKIRNTANRLNRKQSA